MESSYEICDRNPIQLVRQSAKRKAVPVVLTPVEVQRLLSALVLRERTLVLVAFGTGLRMSELFALKWRDVNFQTKEVSIVRSIVFHVISPCKTEASQKPIPLDPQLADALLLWRQQTRFKGPDDWVFASPAVRGQHPYWGQCIMRTFIRPAALRIGIVKPIGWHTFRQHVFFSAETEQDGYKSYRRTTPSRFEQGHARYVYSGSHISQT
jgi:integrase